MPNFDDDESRLYEDMLTMGIKRLRDVDPEERVVRRTVEHVQVYSDLANHFGSNLESAIRQVVRAELPSFGFVYRNGRWQRPSETSTEQSVAVDPFRVFWHIREYIRSDKDPDVGVVKWLVQQARSLPDFWERYGILLQIEVRGFLSQRQGGRDWPDPPECGSGTPARLPIKPKGPLAGRDSKAIPVHV